MIRDLGGRVDDNDHANDVGVVNDNNHDNEAMLDGIEMVNIDDEGNSDEAD